MNATTRLPLGREERHRVGVGGQQFGVVEGIVRIIGAEEMFSDAIGASGGQLACFERRRVTRQQHPIDETGGDVRGSGFQQVVIGVPRPLAINDQIRRIPGRQTAGYVFQPHGVGGLRRGHAPIVDSGEPVAPGVVVDPVGAAKLLEHVVRARIGPVGADGDARARVQRPRYVHRRVVERDVGARRPDQRDIEGAQPLDVARLQADAVIDGIAAPRIGLHIVQEKLAFEFRGAIDAFGDVRNEGNVRWRAGRVKRLNRRRAAERTRIFLERRSRVREGKNLRIGEIFVFRLVEVIGVLQQSRHGIAAAQGGRAPEQMPQFDPEPPRFVIPPAPFDNIVTRPGPAIVRDERKPAPARGRENRRWRRDARGR